MKNLLLKDLANRVGEWLKPATIGIRIFLFWLQCGCFFITVYTTDGQQRQEIWQTRMFKIAAFLLREFLGPGIHHQVSSTTAAVGYVTFPCG